MKQLLLAVSLVFIAVPSFAKKGVVTGRVIDVAIGDLIEGIAPKAKARRAKSNTCLIIIRTTDGYDLGLLNNYSECVKRKNDYVALMDRDVEIYRADYSYLKKTDPQMEALRDYNANAAYARTRSSSSLRLAQPAQFKVVEVKENVIPVMTKAGVEEKPFGNEPLCIAFVTAKNEDIGIVLTQQQCNDNGLSQIIGKSIRVERGELEKVGSNKQIAALMNVNGKYFYRLGFQTTSSKLAQY